ncbi:MAG: hypothetical protein DRI56_13110, partial [Chloroflexota bacterium]
VKQLRANVGTEKLQVKYLTWGIVVAAGFGSLTNIFIPLFFSFYDIQNFGPLATLFLVGFTTYAIVRHRLMDIRVAVRAGLFRLMMVAVLALFLVGAVKVYQVSGAPLTIENLTSAAVAIAFLMAFFYRPLEIWLKAATDRLFFQKEYSYQELLRNLGKIMAQSVDLEEILGHLENTLKEVMKVNYVGFVISSKLKVKNGKIGEEFNSQGRRNEKGGVELTLRGFEGIGYPWSVDNLLLEQMKFEPKIIVTDELSREVAEMPETPRRLHQKQIVAALKKLHAGVLAPLPSKEGLIGLMVLGEKKSLDAFTVQDIQTLESLIYQAGISIENAALFAEVKDFNRRLQQEITIATRNLAIKNKNLSVLRKLDQVIINTLDFEEMGQKLADIVSWEMGYLGALVCFIDNKENKLRGLAVSNTPSLNKVKQMLGADLKTFSLDLDVDPSNLLARSIKEHKAFYSNELADFLTPILDKKTVQKIQEVTGIEHFYGFSLSSKGRSSGAMLIGLPRAYGDLGPGERELIQGFVEESGIALDNARMYSELKRINQQLERANQRLRELDKMKDELVSIASHELRTPMTAIKSYVYMALFREREGISDKAADYLQKAYDSTERMIRLINDMLSVSRLDTGRLTVNLRKDDVQEIIERVLSDLAVKAKEKNIRFIFNKKEDLPLAWIDPDRISEVLINLVGNSIKFSFPGGEIEVRVESRDKEILVSIRDEGPGIPKEDIPRLFKKFGRLQHSFATMAETQGGTGLGLYISRGIVELHGGRIWVESEKGKGSTFFFTLRRAQD